MQTWGIVARQLARAAIRAVQAVSRDASADSPSVAVTDGRDLVERMHRGAGIGVAIDLSSLELHPFSSRVMQPDRT